MTKRGIGARENEFTAPAEFLSIWARPASPPRKSQAPMRFTPKKATATGRPTAKNAVSESVRVRSAAVQVMSTAFHPPQALAEFEHEQSETEHGRSNGVPLGKDERLEQERTALSGIQHDLDALVEHHCRDEEADDVS